MKKINFYVINRTEPTFVEMTGSYERIFDITGNRYIDVVYHKDDNGYWHITHLDSGMTIKSFITSRKNAMQEARELFEATYKVQSNGYIKECIKELEEYKNNLLIGNYNG